MGERHVLRLACRYELTLRIGRCTHVEGNRSTLRYELPCNMLISIVWIVEVGLFMIHSLMIWHHHSLPELLLNRSVHEGRRPYVCLEVARTLSDARMLLVINGIAVPVISYMIIGVLTLVLHYLSSLWRLNLLVISLFIYLIIIVEVVLLLPLVHNSLLTTVTNLSSLPSSHLWTISVFAYDWGRLSSADGPCRCEMGTGCLDVLWARFLGGGPASCWSWACGYTFGCSRTLSWGPRDASGCSV